MLLTTLSKYHGRGKTLTFGLEKSVHYVPFAKDNSVPMFCPICDTCMSNNFDCDAYHRVGCCRSCESDFAEINLEKWDSGWRPDPIEVKRKIKMRNELLLARYLKDMESSNA